MKKSNRVGSGLPTAAGKCVLRGLTLALAIAVALPEEVLAAPMVNTASIQPTFALPDLTTSDLIRVHCCHAHPLPPYDSYCCHGGGAYYGGVGYGVGYGAVGVRGTARRTARRTGRRVSRRR